MTNSLDVEIVLIIIFWYGAWEILDMILVSFLNMIGRKQDYAFRFIFFSIIAIISLVTLAKITEHRNIEKDKNNNKKHRGKEMNKNC